MEDLAKKLGNAFFIARKLPGSRTFCSRKEVKENIVVPTPIQMIVSMIASKITY
jgi:hypothetical protein